MVKFGDPNQTKSKYLMKTLCLFLMCIGFSATNTAQNLNFSQVLLITDSDGAVEVPEGTVWKLTSALVSDPGTGFVGSASTTSATQRIQVNGGDVYLFQRVFRFSGASAASSTSTRSQDQSAIKLTEFPIWLPEGSTVATGLNISGVSVIEFTID